MNIKRLFRHGLSIAILIPAIVVAQEQPPVSEHHLVANGSRPGLLETDPFDGSVSPVRAPVSCPEAHSIVPACNDAEETCLDFPDLFTCVRAGFAYRLAMCVTPGGGHEGHEFDWSTGGVLPTNLALRTPPGTDNDAAGTSTAYIGGDLTVPFPPPPSNGMNFGLLTGDYCGSFDVFTDDTCPLTGTHFECSSAGYIEMRVLGVPDENFPLPFIVVPKEMRAGETAESSGSRGEVGVNLPDGNIGAEYYFDLDAYGGIQNYIWGETVPATLPPGLSINPGTGEITGIPTQTGTFDFEISLVENAADPIFVNDPPCDLAPQCPPLDDIQPFIITIQEAILDFCHGYEAGEKTTCEAGEQAR